MRNHRTPTWRGIATACLVAALTLMIVDAAFETLLALDRIAADAAAWDAVREASR
jgi:hypothetical protein